MLKPIESCREVDELPLQGTHASLPRRRRPRQLLGLPSRTNLEEPIPQPRAVCDLQDHLFGQVRQNGTARTWIVLPAPTA